MDHGRLGTKGTGGGSDSVGGDSVNDGSSSATDMFRFGVGKNGSKGVQFRDSATLAKHSQVRNVVSGSGWR